MFDSTNKIRWACRRGMLELDVLLLHFIETKFNNLNASEKTEFEALLAFPDPVLFAWLTQQECPPVHLQAIVEAIRHAKSGV